MTQMFRGVQCHDLLFEKAWDYAWDYLPKNVIIYCNTHSSIYMWCLNKNLILQVLSQPGYPANFSYLSSSLIQFT